MRLQPAALAILLAYCWPSMLSAQSNEFRGVWVDAWGTGFLNASQVTQLINDCRTYNFNAIVVQMRRRGDAFYTPGNIGNDPKTTAIASSYDALADILTKARTGSPRIEVHCWVTTFLIWSDSVSPPSQAGHVYNLHPEYLTKNSAGQGFISEGYYLDPGNPDATLWNYVMATNIVRRYDLDGFHWDYIRYPTTDSGYNPTAVARYNAEFGLSGQPSPSDSQFSSWRRRQVTDFLRWVNADLLEIRTNLAISCSVFGSRSDAFNARFQDWAAWNNEGIIDLCMPMGYTSDNNLFQSRVNDAFNNQGVRRVYSGQGAYLNTKENTVWQLDYVRSKGLLGSMFYSYRTPNSGTVDRSGTLTHVRDNHQPSWVNPPSIPWKATPTKGLLKGTITRSDNGAPIYNATVRLFTSPNRTQKTEPHGKYAFFETTPGNYTITATATGMGSVTNNVTIAAGGLVNLNLVVPVTDNSAPIISNIAVSNLTDTSATITWLTDENSDSVVEYGTNVAYGFVLTNATAVLNHSLTLSNLAPNTLYHFRVKSKNPANLQSISSDRTLTTNPAGVVNDLIIDDAQASYVGSWTSSSTSPGYYGSGYRYKGSGTGSAYAQFRPNILTAGTYQVSVWYVDGGNRTTQAQHLIRYQGGNIQTNIVNQQIGGSQWLPLGTFNFNAGTNGYVRVTDAFSSGSVVMADAVRWVYVPPPQPPLITNPPAGKSVAQNANATFSVGASGSSPLAYRWRLEGSFLPGATASSYTVTNAQPANEGDYSVVITNIAGSVTSAPAFLIVHVPPYISQQPQNQTVKVGTEATFVVSAGGSEPLHYQWRFDGTNLPGATSSSYARSPVQASHAGVYTVSVTNIAGQAFSSNALLLVNSAVPATIESLSLLPDGRARLVVNSETGQSCIIEHSLDLNGWTELTERLNTNGSFEVIDDGASNATLRFYRTRQ